MSDSLEGPAKRIKSKLATWVLGAGVKQTNESFHINLNILIDLLYPRHLYFTHRYNETLYSISRPLVHKNRMSRRAVNKHRSAALLSFKRDLLLIACEIMLASVETYVPDSHGIWPIVYQSAFGEPSWEVVGRLPYHYPVSHLASDPSYSLMTLW